MKIYSALGVELLDLIVDDKSYRYKVIMDENTMTLYFNMPDFHEIPEGSYCDYKNERYFLLDTENFKQIHSRNFEYTLVLDSYQALTKLVKYKFFTMNGNTVDSAFELKFSLTATPADFAQLLVNNMNISDAVGGWSVGECIESDPVCIDFSHDWCYDVLPKMADAFKTEWEFENKTLHIRKVEKMKESPIPLKYGYDFGLLPGISRTNSSNAKVITRLFIEGGDRNIDKSTYGSSTLCMPKNHTITYMGIDYKTDATGTYIERVTPLGRLKEGSLDVTKIYPKRVGTVSAVNVVNADTNLYDVIDSSIPGTLDFSALVIAGETMTIILQTGQLAGKEFEVKYKSADKRFELVPLSENGLNYPSGSLIPEVGDKYAVFNISLPTDYITSAETDVLNDAVKYLWENEQPKYTVTGTLDAIYAKRNWLAIGGFLNCGYFVSLSSDEFLTSAMDIRIVAVKEFINKPKEPEITLSNEVSGKTLGSELNKTSTQEQAINRKDAEVVRFARRQFSDIKQTTEMLQSALLNFSSSISPLTVQTMQILAGDETLQFEFVASSTSTTSVAHNESYNPATKQFSSAAGVLQHKTLGVTTLSSSHAASDLKWWNMTAFVSAVLDVSDKSYYLYAKVSKTANTGVFLLSETAIALEGVAGYYHLLMGILNSENEADRSYSQMYGYSELTPGRMTVKKVVSPSGNTFFDLENEVIQGNIKFQSGVTVETGISNAKSEAVQLASNDATTKANTAISTASADATNKANNAIQTAKEYSDAKVAVINQSLADLQTQSDGAVSNWPSNTQTEAPTLSNFPANQWTSNTERDRHILDVYTNYQEYVSDAATPNAGKSWKFVKSEAGIYSWSLIADNNQSKAYLMSVKATAIANQKITTFSTIPNTLMADGFCYRKGDLWSLKAAWNGFTVGELLSASQDSTSFVSSDWTKWVKYTDDTAVNNLQIGGKNLVLNSLATHIGIGQIHTYTLSEPLVEGQRYAISLKGDVGAGANFNVWCNQDQNNILHLDSNGIAKGNFYYIQGNKPTLIGIYSEQSLNPSTIYWIKIEKGDKATDFTIADEDFSSEIDAAKQSANNAQTTANAANSSVSSLNTYVDGAFKDGVISTSEAQAIEKYKNQVTKDFNDLIAGYNVVYANSYLVGSPKTDLLNAKVTMSGAKDNLMTSINNAIADGKTTVSEKADVDSKYSAWDSSYSTYKSKLELANKAIQANLDSLAQQAANTAKDTAISTASADATNKANAAMAVANAAQSTANTAVSNAATAQVAANTANSAIANITSDNVLSASEKSGERTRWNASLTEKSGIDTQSTAFGITTEKQAYDSAFQALATYLNAGTTYTSGVPLWLDDTNLSSNTTIVGTTYRTTWELMLSTRQILLNSIATKAKTTADNAQTTVDNLRFSSRNIIKNSGIQHSGIGILSTYDLSKPLVIGRTYTVSIKATVGSGASFNVWYDWNNTQLMTVPFGTSEISKTFICGNISDLSRISVYSEASSNPSTVYWIAMVEGDKPMIDWQEAPEDDYVKKAIKGSASINGGLVLGNVMAVTDENGNVMAGMNGLAGAQYPIWSGAPNASNANFSVDKYGNLKAFSGQFGNFMIENGALVGYANNTEKVRLHTGALPTLDSLVNANWVRCALEFNTSGVIGGVVNDFHNDLFVDTVYYTVTGYLSIPSNTNVKFHAQIIDTVSASPPDGIEISDFIQLVEVYNSGGSLVATNYLDGANVYLSAGTYLVKYTFQVSVNFIGQTSADIVVVSDSNAWMEYQGGITRLEMANDGFFMYYNATEYFYFKQGVGKFEKGFTDSPGVLAAGSIASGGGSDANKLWGAKKSSTAAQYTPTGQYRVFHNIGHSDYTVDICCSTAGAMGSWVTKGSTYVDIQIYKNNAAFQSGFDYKLTGHN